MKKQTIILLVSMALIGLFLSEINEVTGEILLTGMATKTTCSDNEEGLNYGVKGTVTYTSRFRRTPRTLPDRCRRNRLYEYYCEGNRLKIERHICPQGCSEGICIGEVAAETAPAPTPTAQCTDPDGLNLGIKGTTRGTGVSGEEVTNIDRCISKVVLNEYFCSNNIVKDKNYNCPKGHECKNGACIPKLISAPAPTPTTEAEAAAPAPAPAPTVETEAAKCTDPDGKEGYYTKGTVSKEGWDSITDYCVTSTILTEALCNVDDNPAYAKFDCPTGYTCKDGACIKEAPPPTIPTAGLVAHYKFDKASGTAASDETTNADGTITGATWETTGCTQGSCLNFGINDYVEIANEANFDFEHTDPFSISMWIKPTQMRSSLLFGKHNSLIPNQQGYLLKILRNKIDVIIQSSEYYSGYKKLFVRSSDEVITLNKWNHVVVTYDGSGNANGISIYIDSSLISRISDLSYGPLTSRGTILNDVSPRIGNYYGDNSGFPGAIDEVRVYSTKLTASDVQAIYEAEK